MGDHRPFHFGVLSFGEPSRDAWVEQVQRAESLGYSTISVGEHTFCDLAPLSALASAAMVTSDIRIGSMVLANDFRNPALLAKEASSIDVLSSGRFEFGIGTGYMRRDYAEPGIRFDPPATRLDRLFEAVRLIKSAFEGEAVSGAGEHYTFDNFKLYPKPVQCPHPPLLIGGGGRRVLQFAAREADIVGINIMSTPDGGFDWASVSPEATAEKIQWVNAAAGDRLQRLELHWLVLFAAVTDTPGDAARQMLESWDATDDISVDALLASPHVLIGSEDWIESTIVQRREEYGISYMTIDVSAMEAFAPIIAHLAGS